MTDQDPKDGSLFHSLFILGIGAVIFWFCLRFAFYAIVEVVK